MGEKTTPHERAPTSRSRGDRSRPPTVTAARAEAVTGRLPEAEWLSLLEAEQGDRDVGDIMAELVGRVMDECAKAHAARQCVPFAVGWARDALLQGTMWRFPARDEGDTDPQGDGAWQEDEEPEPPVVDAWAQGSVPVLSTCLSPGEGEQVSGAQAPCQQDPTTAAEAGAPPVQPSCPGQVASTGDNLPVPGPSLLELLPDQVAITPRPTKGKPPRARHPLPRPALGQPEQGQCPPRPSHGDVEGSKVAGVSSHVPSLPPPSCASLVEIRPGKPLCITGAKRGGSGTVPGVPRLGPGRRPERWIRPQVEVLDAEAKPPACPQGARWHSRGPWPSRGLVTVAGGQLQPPPPGSPQPPRPLPRQLGSLLGSTRLAPGVTVRRGGSVRHGLRIPARGQEEEEEEEEETGEAKRDLRPIGPTVPFPATAARQVTGDGER